MRWLDKLEARLGWVAFPGLFKYLTYIGAVVFAWQYADPGASEAIAFDRDKILSGEVWRVVSFIFAPMGTFAFGAIGVLFLFFALMIAALISDSLEQVWGPTRTTLYIIVAWLGLVVGQFVFDPPTTMSGVYLYNAMFFAFATYFPRLEFRLFLILPVQVRYIAWFLLAVLLLSVLADLRNLGLMIPTLLPYALWVLPNHVVEKRRLAESAVRRRKFNASQAPADEAFHRCAVCDRTERDDSRLDFRVMPDGTEYCVEHLPKQEDSRTEA